MYKLLGKLKNEIIHKEIIIPIDKIKSSKGEFIEIDDIFVGSNSSGFIAYDRVCDHNGGQLILNPSNLSATCPLHKWTLKLADSLYENGCPKKPLPVRVESANLIVIKSEETFPIVDTCNLTTSDINFKFNAHASVSIEIDGISIISDPWLVGSCFANGWWHAFPPTNEAMERLRSSDFIYISHNHPDHLHIPTLENYVEKSKLILVPNFQSKSVENILRRNGFNNLVICDFMQEVLIKTMSSAIKLVMIKSGDERDDSSLLVCTARRKIFLGVDTNMPNRWVLPKVDVLFTLFAGGASGFPARIENFDLAKKNEIINAKRANILSNHVAKLINSTMPDYIIPYAGYFTEISRDGDVKEINKKNSPRDLKCYIEEKFPNIIFINPIDSPIFRLGDGGLEFEEISEHPAYFLDDDYISSVISDGLKGRGDLSVEELLLVGKRFLLSNFFDDLTVIFIPTNESMTEDVGFALLIDFSPKGRKAEIINLNGDSDRDLVASIGVGMNNLELLRVRAESFALAIRDGLPLEDLSIGFQIKMYRQPNVYNFKFWDYFTNKEFISL